MLEYISVAEAAKKFDISERRVQVLCEQGRLNGAKQISGVWIIPELAQKPVDARSKESNSVQLSLFDFSSNNAEDIINLEELCKMLSISIATGHNWVRLGKIKPLDRSKQNFIFSKKETEAFLENIKDSNATLLKSRRNKKQIKGNILYSDYVCNSRIINNVSKLLKAIPEEIEIDEQHIRLVLANIALQFTMDSCSAQHPGNKVPIEEFLFHRNNINIPQCLIDDIIESVDDPCKIIAGIKDALKINFEWSSTDDVLGLVYMSLRGLGSRKLSGAYYTPSIIVERLITSIKCDKDLSQSICLDPCCGSGNFLLKYADVVNSPKNVYGQDNDALAVMLARLNFAVKYKISDIGFLYTHFTVGDSLIDLPKRTYDIILGNPPWGYEFSENTLRSLYQRYRTASVKTVDSYDLFVERGLSLLPQGGLLAFVLPEAMLNVRSHKLTRELLIREGSFSFISYIGNAFPGVQCPSICLGVYKGTGHTDTIRVYDGGKDFLTSASQQFTANSINFRSSNEEQACLEAIRRRHGKAYLKGNAVFALGIVTGNNKELVLNSKTEESEMILKGSDIKRFFWASSGNYINFTPKKFQQVAPIEYYRAPEKLLYRFICDGPVFAYDDKQTLSLNSCNILIPRIEGLSIKYVLAVLNSRVVDFFCRKSFNSVKLLRSHIEEIPIPIPNSYQQSQIVSEIDNLLLRKTSVSLVYDKIDSMVMEMFDLSPDQKSIILLSCKDRNLFLD